MSPRLGLTGDVMLGRLVDERQRGRPVDAVWGDMRGTLAGLDGLIINLECCLSTRGRPWSRTYRPFHFRADPARAIPALEAAGVDVCALANNHVLDFEEVALEDTVDALDAGGIARSGAGRTLDAALEPAVVEVDGVTVVVVSLTDNTPEYAATASSPGTAHCVIDVGNAETRETVTAALDRAAQAEPDCLIASLHWGPNMTETPPDGFRRFARWLVEEGVDVVHGHSAHVFHGVELYAGRPVLYDTGDFVDDYAVDPDLRNDRSFLFELRVTEDGRPTDLRLHPVEIADCAVNRAPEPVAAWCRSTMRRRSTAFETAFERRDGGLSVAIASTD